MTIQEVLSSANYDVKGLDNRKRTIKSLNSVFANSPIQVAVCEKGRLWVGKDGFKYNVKISLEGAGTTRFKLGVTPYDLLKAMGYFLRRDEVKAKIYSEVSVPHKCHKCEGTGILPQFMYYADGVCFDCMGVGMVGFLNVSNIQDRKEREKQGHPYIRTFYVSGNYAESFPDGVENIQPTRHYNHGTAIEYLGKKDEFYYIHAPICKRNDWYKIPASEIEKFAREWNKVNDKSNHIHSYETI